MTRQTSSESPAFEPGSLVVAPSTQTVHRVSICGERIVGCACNDAYPVKDCEAYSEVTRVGAAFAFCGCVGAEAHELTDDADVKANAHLVAAAPAMFSALEWVVADREEFGDVTELGIALVCSALAKARGES